MAQNDTWRKIEETRQLKDVDRARTQLEKRNAMQQYRIKGRRVKDACRRDKRAHINQVAADVEEAASKGDLNRLYQTTRIVSGRKPNQRKPICNKKGDILAKADEQLARWKEHVEEVLNRPPPIHQPVLQPGEELPIKTDNISLVEIRFAVKSLKIGKATEIDNIPSGAFMQVVKCQLRPCTNYLIRCGEKRKSLMNGRKVCSLNCQRKGIPRIVRIGEE